MGDGNAILTFLEALFLLLALATVLYRGRSVLQLSALFQELALITAAFFAYFTVRGATEGSASLAFANASALASFEQRLGFFWEPRLQGLIIDHHWIVTFMNWVYIWGHWPFIGIVAMWLFLFHRDMYRLIRNAFLISGAIGLIIFAVFPVAPPRLTEADVVDTVSLYSDSYRVLQPPGLVNQYAALPSLHFGWNLLIGIALFARSRPPIPRLVGIAIPFFMLLAVVLTANHYIIDAAAGGSLALLGLVTAYNLPPAAVGTQSSTALVARPMKMKWCL